MQSLRGWEELCALRVAAQWEEDAACLALTAKFVAGATPTPTELERWNRARERSNHVYARLRAHANIAGTWKSAVDPSVPDEAGPSVGHEISGPMQPLQPGNVVASQKSEVEPGLPVPARPWDDHEISRPMLPLRSRNLVESEADRCPLSWAQRRA